MILKSAVPEQSRKYHLKALESVTLTTWQVDSQWLSDIYLSKLSKKLAMSWWLWNYGAMRPCGNAVVPSQGHYLTFLFWFPQHLGGTADYFAFVFIYLFTQIRKCRLWSTKETWHLFMDTWWFQKPHSVYVAPKTPQLMLPFLCDYFGFIRTGMHSPKKSKFETPNPYKDIPWRQQRSHSSHQESSQGQLYTFSQLLF